MRNFGGTSFTTLRLNIGTTFEQADFVVMSRNGPLIQNGTVWRDSPVSFDINAGFQISTSGYIDREKGIHVYTTNNANIFVIAENILEPFNHGVFVPYPCLTFETQTGYEYYVISTEVAGNTKSQVLLVGCEDDTEISITPAQNISLPQDLQMNSSTFLSLETGGTHNDKLHQMQTLLINSFSDLTGTKIVSNKPLTVIAGHECASVPSHRAGCEPLAFQVPPSLTWGNTFLLSTSSGRETDSIIKFVATEGTSVSVVCGSTNSLSFSNATSLQIAIPARRNCYVVSSNPILLVLFATSGLDDGRGDPAITLISPTDQYINSIPFLAPPINTFTEVYISVTVSSEHFNSSSILLDQETLDCVWNEIYNASSETASVVGYGCNSSINDELNTTITQHLISHRDPKGLLSVIVYGFRASEQPDSYTGFAYLAGQEITVGKQRDMQFASTNSICYQIASK